MCELVLQVGNELLQLAVMFGCDVLQHKEQQIKTFKVFVQIPAPCYVVEVLQGYFCLLSTYEHVGLAVVKVKIAAYIFYLDCAVIGCFQTVEFADG